MSVHTEFIIPNQVVVLRIMPSVFLVLLRLLEASNCSDGLLLFWHVIFFTLNLNSELWLIWTWWIYSCLILLNYCLILFFSRMRMMMKWRVDNIYQCTMSCACAFLCIWSRSQSYGCDSTGTHRALPEEACDVKEVMAFAFMKVITTLYIIVDLMVEVFIREKQTLRFVDA